MSSAIDGSVDTQVLDFEPGRLELQARLLGRKPSCCRPTRSSTRSSPLSYEILQKPSWLDYSYIPGTGHRFYGKSNDTRARSYHTIQIRATDPSGASAVVTFQVEATYDYIRPGGGGNPARVAQAFLATQEASVQAAAAPAPAQATSSTERVEESWYAYDRLNRVSIVNGNLQNGQVVLGVNDRSYGVSYAQLPACRCRR